MDVPQQLPDQIIEVLKIFLKEQKLTTDEIVDKLPESAKDNALKRIYNMAYDTGNGRVYLKNMGDGYALTPFGKKVLKKIDSIIVRPYKKRSYKARKARKAATPAPPPPPPQLNISPTADKLADQVTAVFAEVAEYREALLGVISRHKQEIDKLYKILKMYDKENDNGDST